MTCRHCHEPIRETHDPNLPHVHETTGNAYCDVTDPASAVFLAAFNPTGMRTEAAPTERERFEALDGPGEGGFDAMCRHCGRGIDYVAGEYWGSEPHGTQVCPANEHHEPERTTS